MNFVECQNKWTANIEYFNNISNSDSIFWFD